MGRRRRDKLGIDYIGGLKEESTAFAGVGLLVDVYRQAGIGATAEKALPQKRSPRGLRQGQMVEVFVALSSLGGESFLGKDGEAPAGQRTSCTAGV